MVFFLLLCYNTFGDIMLICPVCKEKLQIVNNSYKCINNHSFDISKSGYTNLLISKTNSGDNQEMVNARFVFLNKGYYKNVWCYNSVCIMCVKFVWLMKVTFTL